MKKSASLFPFLSSMLLTCIVQTGIVRDACCENTMRFVSTPFGRVKKSDVIYLKHNEELVFSTGHKVQVIDKKSGKTIRCYHHGQVFSPARPLSYNGRSVPFGDFSPLNSYMALAKLKNDYLVQSFSTDWNVPLPPMYRKSANPDFLWSGIQGGTDPDRITFAQSVMSWDESRNSYCIQNWGYVNGVLVGGERALVAPGTRLTGVAEFIKIDKDTGKYEYISRFKGYPALDLDVDGYPRPNMVIEQFEPFPPKVPETFPSSGSGLMYHIKLVTRPAFRSSRLAWTVSPADRIPLPSGKPNTEIVSDSATDGKVRFNWH